MQISTKVTGLVGAGAGVLMAVVAYQSISSVAEPIPKGTAPISKEAPASLGTNGLADCAPPGRLVKGVCVTRVERKVVVYDAPARPDAGRARASDDDGAYEENLVDEPGVREDHEHEGESAEAADSFEDDPEHATQEVEDD